ncbi:tail completion protein gp17 [Pleomorphomonas carboxyditropha]|uniref:DUF3168 domain-containing protein n=1 Tax=Pleomorphomonas carboxyditropha TaxID=2023338 RepID=A0A2G9WQ68_9HYPH|nr:DUF3168 domain-containing protein [Pleomorphomonas carboxyditropha]PIO96858.1 hypothetical protein CJ014_22980 [Pleomorphomonas carboxyditropha]
MSAIVITIAALAGAANVAAIVGDRVEIEPGTPSTPPPRITVALVDEEETYTLSGAGNYPTSRVSVICVALSAADAHRLAAEVKAALNDCDGEFSGFYATFRKAGTEYADWSDDQTTHRVIVDYLVDWKPAG